jgi:hypothetical protein
LGYRRYELKFDYLQDPPALICDHANQKADNPSLFVFPYDWRESNIENAAKLKNYIDCVQQFYPGSQVDILTHSMGSLIARRYIIDNPIDHRINKLVTVAAPWLGAAKLIYVLQTGDFLNMGNMPVVNSGFKKIARSSPAPQQLGPGRVYYDLLGISPLVEHGWDLDKDGVYYEEYSYDDYKEVINKLYGRTVNGKVFAPGTEADDFHQGAQDDWTADSTGIGYYHLYGIQGGENVIGGVEAIYYTTCGPGNHCLLQEIFEFKKQLALGDGTVPWFSAQRIGYNAPNACLVMFYGPSANGDDLVEHNGLNRNPLIHLTLFSLLTRGLAPPHPSQPISPCTPASTVQSTVTTLPEPQPYTYLTVHGGSLPIVRDSLGHSTVPISDTFRGEVPGVTHYTLAERSDLIVLPFAGTYTVTLQTTDEPLAVELTKGTSDTATRAIRYMDLSLPQGVTAMLKITDQGADMLRYDSDGDGNFETSVTPTVDISGPQASDLEPPAITVQAVKQQDIVKVTLSAQDSGSGVKALYYSLDGTNFQPYTTQLQVDPTQAPILYAFADDNVANRATLVYPLSSASEDHQIYLPVILKNR